MAIDLDKQLDAALGDILSQGWSDPDEPTVQKSLTVAEPEPTYPPLPQRDGYLEPQAHDGALKRNVTPAGDEDAPRGVMNIGLLTDLAAGRKTAVDAAAEAGVTPDELQTDLAVALREVDPKEIAKALGLQAAEQQLKSGALYGAVLASLVDDVVAGRMKPDTKIELAKLLAKVGRVEPKEDRNVGAGGGFVLNINLGAAGAAPVVIESN